MADRCSLLHFFCTLFAFYILWSMSHAIRRRTPCNFFRNFRYNNGKSRNVTGLLEILHGQLVNFRFDAFVLQVSYFLYALLGKLTSFRSCLVFYYTCGIFHQMPIAENILLYVRKSKYHIFVGLPKVVV